MQVAKLHEIFLIISFVLVQYALKRVACNLSYENKNFVKIKQDPTRFQLASAYRNKNNNYATRYFTNATTPTKNNKRNAYETPRRAHLGIGGNYSQDKYKIVSNNDKGIPQASQHKKWQVGRVSRKQYEIINMLWRKTKIFVDVESTTANYIFRQNNDSFRSIRQPFIRLPSRPSLSSTTSSYIEFYYLDETDERIKDLTTKKHIEVSTMREHLIRNHGNHKFVLSDSPMFAFRIHDPNYKQPTITNRFVQQTNKIKRRKARTRDSSLTGFDSLNSIKPSHKFPHKRMKQNKFITNSTTSSILKKKSTLHVTSTVFTIPRIPTQQNKFMTNSTPTRIPKKNSALNVTSTILTSEYIYDNETCPTTVDFVNDTTESENITSDTVSVTQKQASTTAYDKIKFFEMFDKHTPLPYYEEKGRLYDMENVDLFIKGNELNNNEPKVLLENVDQSIGNEYNQPHTGKHSKKHIIDTFKSESNNPSNAHLIVEKKITMLNVSNAAHPPALISNVTKRPIIKLLQSDSKLAQSLANRNSKKVKWSEYPFAAAYVYEPSQVHCDAAGISPHWLVTSGSCLSRHHKNPGGVGRSAFVTYCGVAWWNPERVAYVKYSVVHPRFHPRDKTRRHLYNIGLIQIVNSMASACNGWSSISLMSHQIVTEGEGAVANAVGWGLDRFDTRYSSSDLPKSLLMSYENQVFSRSCPGNIGYGKAKRLSEEGGIKNVYCLALPPYSGEATDPIHGGILLVGGKLVALYLQEERRPWGDQCAQYTGTWRLVPWILDIARENDDVDTFTLDI